MDSGAFSEISTHGHYRQPVSEYADQIRRWKSNGNLLAAVAQDFMCEPWIIEKTGLTVSEHQRLTIERFDALLVEDTGVYILPVLQGYTPEDYLAHLRAYGDRLKHGAWVGVGSICKRNGDPRAVAAVLLAIKKARPDKERMLDHAADKRADLESTLRTLLARLVEAEGDARRIDWMQSTETTPWRIVHQEWRLRTDGSSCRDKIEVFEGWSVSGHDEPHPTIRAAIDAAMNDTLED